MKHCLLNGKWPLNLPDHRADRHQWTNPPYWEPERLDAMHALIEPGDLLYDIGAEEGDMTALFASWGADIVAVEANPLVWPNIRACFEGNGLERHVRGWFVGFCGDESSRRSRPRWERAYGGSGRWPRCADGPVIGNHGFLVLPERPDCPATTIEALAAAHGPPTVITIDTEGSEYLVLLGAAEVLADHRPAVFVSVHIDMPWLDEKFDGDTGPRIEALMALLGYEGRELAIDHERHMEYRHPEGR